MKQADSGKNGGVTLHRLGVVLDIDGSDLYITLAASSII